MLVTLRLSSSRLLMTLMHSSQRTTELWGVSVQWEEEDTVCLIQVCGCWCKLVFQVWKENTQSPTYGALRSALDKYSVFCGRNPLVSCELY